MDYNVRIEEQNVYDQPVKNDLRTSDIVRKIAIGQGDDCNTACPLDYIYFNNYYKMVAIDLNK